MFIEGIEAVFFSAAGLYLLCVLIQQYRSE
jgi:hypothetical protein